MEDVTHKYSIGDRVRVALVGAVRVALVITHMVSLTTRVASRATIILSAAI